MAAAPRAPEARRPSPEERAARRKAALAAGTLARGPGSTEQHPARAVTIPAEVARAEARATIIAGLVAFLAQLSKRDHGWLQSELARKAPAGKVTADEITALVAEEDKRGQQFAEGVVKRVTADLTTALAIPDPDKRSQAVQGVLARERNYARMRSEAMAARAFAALERVAVKHDSPQGAFWKLDPTVAEHTAGCLIMGGKFWPWAVLDRVHPPRHPGCPCRLKSYASAITDGDMRAGDVLNVTDAVRRSAGVVMEQAEADALVEELELRDRLVESGLVSAESLAAIPLVGA